MWDYSEKVQEHFYNPRNAGALEEANGVGDVGSLSCGDALRLMLKVEPDSEVILDARFQTFGCGSAIASSSALTEMIKGKTLDEALKVSNQDIADYLDGLPPEKMHCSVMGREALQAAVANYRGEVWSDDHEEGALICKCFAIDAVLIEDTIRANNLSSVEEVTNYTKAGGGCSACHEGIEEILVKVLAERGETFSVDAGKTAQVVNAAPSVGGAAQVQADAMAALTQIEMPVVAAGAVPAASGGPKLTNLQRIRKIEEVIERSRPALQRDRGDIELIDVDGRTVYVKLTGACSGCQMASMTLSGIQQQMMEELKEFIQLVPVSKAPATTGV
ncbi:MAG: Fe-S cluster assembly protein NifU [Marinospirillum sp.]|uniref:Fe-S cluster assembly protein NifU n=1 Tax=Marinospirillum sp. TaxID=2183934 RepID=UPI0019F940F9|nr:Fe-S cluster assembly protein NifU [Marinospirillum sp.]MBE0506708.1 Fe-S cluster assembly protein NifU [Marinospirillum sp.]